jgi:LysR family hydrogen peroxide-inducible transcriptional activator
LPRVAVDVELRDERVKLLRFVEPGRLVGLAWRRTSPRKADDEIEFVIAGIAVQRTASLRSPMTRQSIFLRRRNGPPGQARG